MRMYDHAHETKVAVAGASGYAGGELLRLLLGHPAVEIGALTAGSNAGETLGALQPHLTPLADRVLVETSVGDARRPRRGLPGAAARTVRGPGRASSATTRWWSTAAPTSGSATRPSGSGSTAATHAGTWPYGLPELPGQRDVLRGARRIAVPGCYPTVSTLALAPAVAAGLVTPDVVVVAASGTSGAGKAAKAAPARQRGDGQRVGVRRRRHAPPHPRDRPEPLGALPTARCASASRRCWCRCRAASSPPARRR